MCVGGGVRLEVKEQERWEVERERYWEYKEFVKEKINKVGRKWIEDDWRKTG